MSSSSIGSNNNNRRPSRRENGGNEQNHRPAAIDENMVVQQQQQAVDSNEAPSTAAPIKSLVVLSFKSFMSSDTNHHWSHDDVVCAMENLIAALEVHDSSSTTTAKEVIETGCPKDVFAAMMDHRNDKGVQVKGYQTLSILLRFNQITILEAHRVLRFCLELLERVEADPKVQGAVWMLIGPFFRKLDVEESGVVVTFGNNDFGQLGLPDDLLAESVYPPRLVTDVATGGKVRQLACGGLHNVVLMEEGDVLTWGANDEGALGRETDASTEATPMVVTGFDSQTGMQEDGQIIAISAGDSHTLFLTKNRIVYMVGSYRDADLGKFRDIGNAGADPMGKNTMPVQVWQLDQNVVQIYSGGGFNVAMLSDHSIVTWGFGFCGELARSADMIRPNAEGNFDLMKAHVDEETGQYDLDFVRGMFLKPGPVLFATGSPKKSVLTVACGFSHLLVVAYEPNEFHPNLYTSGLNNYGQLGHGDNVQRHELTPVAALKHVDVGKVAAGQFHSMCLNLVGSEVYSWGREDYGQLGLGKMSGTGKFKSVPVLVKFPAIEGPEVRLFSEIACGDHNSMALTTDHELYTWGFEGTTGQRGYNHKDLSVPTMLPLAERIRGRTGPDMHVLAHKMDGGGQHSAVLVKRYTKEKDENDGKDKYA